MPTPAWEPGKLYPPGSLVVPRTTAPVTAVPVTNGGFESGDLTGWSYTTVGGSETLVVVAANPYAGVYAAYWEGGNGSGSEGGIECIAVSDDRAPVNVGQLVTGSIRIKYNTTGDHDGSRGQARLHWFDELGNEVGTPSQGYLVKGRGNNNKWVTSSVSGQCPPGATRVAFAVWVTARGGHVYFDAADWNYAANIGLQYKAVQTAAGYSNTAEPAWPDDPGESVVDNEVTWQAVLMSRIVWQARPVLTSGATEPTWPTTAGGTVADGTIAWKAVSRRVEDPNCPQSAVTTIIASKVFKADGDIVRFSATANPLDWTTENDAGYLPTGLQQANANDMAVLAPYRGNLSAFNASSFQNWQVDPDPANMAIVDQMDGVGSVWQGAAQAVGNELFYLSQLGVRSVGIAAATQNMQAGDVGEPIDPLIRDAIAYAKASGKQPIGAYYPGAGQYWIAFPDFSTLPSPLALTGDLPNLQMGTAVSGFAYVASGGFPPYTYSITDGALPTGLTMDSAGNVTGTPITGGSFWWTVKVVDSAGGEASLLDTAMVSSFLSYLTSPPYSVVIDELPVVLSASVVDFRHSNGTIVAPATTDHAGTSAEVLFFEHKDPSQFIVENMGVSAAITAFEHKNLSQTIAENAGISADIVGFLHQDLSQTVSENAGVAATIQEFIHA